MRNDLHPWIRDLGEGAFLQLYPDRFSDDELHGFLAATEDFLSIIPQPYGWVVEIGGVIRASARQRKAIAAMGERSAAFARRYNAGTAVVAKGRMARGLVKTTYLLQKPPYPATVVETALEGERWVREQLAEWG